MFFKHFYLGGLAHASHMIGSNLSGQQTDHLELSLFHTTKCQAREQVINSLKQMNSLAFRREFGAEV